VGVLYGNPETTSGGNALKFYASVRVDVRAKEKIEGANKEIIGNRVRARCVKNKVSGPYKEAEFDVLFGKGIDYLGGIFDAAETCGVIRRAGAFYSFGEERLGQGRERSMQALRDSADLRERLEKATRAQLEGGVTESIDEDAVDGDADGLLLPEDDLPPLPGSPL